MATSAKILLEAALKLTASERADLAALLLESLDEGADDGVEEAWIREAEKRNDEIESGAVETIPWEQVRSRLYR